jgi:hypothetical protein
VAEAQVKVPVQVQPVALELLFFDTSVKGLHLFLPV